MSTALLDKQTEIKHPSRTIKDDIPVYILEFLVFAFIGWTYETIYTSIAWGRFAERGFLHLPICPIYGFFSFFIILTLGKLKFNVPILYILCTACIGLLEYIASYILEKCFNLELWNYSYMKFDINGRVSVVICLIFGAACIFLLKILHPKLYKLFNKTSSKNLKIISYSLLVITIADTIYTTIFTFSK